MLSILFVEDDATIAMGVEYSLKQDGFQVSLAYRLEEARDLLKYQPFDLVLLDLGLPDGSGYALCKEIRAAGDTPIIILSARDEEASIVLGLDLGADDYITKPFRLRLAPPGAGRGRRPHPHLRRRDGLHPTGQGIQKRPRSALNRAGIPVVAHVDPQPGTGAHPQPDPG